ncbi:MAG: flagellar biosynthesis anti-sigma factor FlgM [Rhodoferax sp.]|jgi:negative regulator of flagellin synthesis FlgM|nr:flagellar biosynthesis anti-sigma factor FlgM [Rhodoferax sp.]
MKIDNSNQVHLNNVSANQKTGQPATATPTASAARGAQSAGVAVTVSTLARGLEKAARSDAADIDTQKVASVKSAIQDGTYVVNPEAIADKLLSNAQEMLKRTTS